jgi:histidyl-tRNA synthetase
MFRAERPQAGRLRQFHQYGVEAIGSSSPWVDVEVITLCVEMLRACGVTRTAVWLSSMGCRDDQHRSAAALRKRLTPHKTKLCAECRKRFDKNVFRVLDCRNPTCRALVWKDAASPFQLCDDCRAHADAVREGLRDAHVAFDESKVFARGLDYYTRTVFEVRAEGLGAQDAVAAGGRYDHLVEEFGGPPMGACGFAAGIERLLMAAEHQGAKAPTAHRRGLYLAVAQPALLKEAFRFVQQLRAKQVTATLDYDGRSLKAQLREADKAGCRFVAILGEQELRQRAMTVKDLEQSGQETITFDAFVDTVVDRLKTKVGACH